jgi:hypothetical protein
MILLFMVAARMLKESTYGMTLAKSENKIGTFHTRDLSDQESMMQYD